jgi:hypothetical protein
MAQSVWLVACMARQCWSNLRPPGASHEQQHTGSAEPQQCGLFSRHINQNVVIASQPSKAQLKECKARQASRYRMQPSIDRSLIVQWLRHKGKGTESITCDPHPVLRVRMTLTRTCDTPGQQCISRDRSISHPQVRSLLAAMTADRATFEHPKITSLQDTNEASPIRHCQQLQTII